MYNLVELTKEGYEKYPAFSGLSLHIINEDETRYRIKSVRGEKWIDKILFVTDEKKKKAKQPKVEKPIKEEK